VCFDLILFCKNRIFGWLPSYLYGMYMPLKLTHSLILTLSLIHTHTLSITRSHTISLTHTKNRQSLHFNYFYALNIDWFDFEIFRVFLKCGARDKFWRDKNSKYFSRNWLFPLPNSWMVKRSHFSIFAERENICDKNASNYQLVTSRILAYPLGHHILLYV